MSDVVWFDDADGCAPTRVGGKGANLGLLRQAGFPVPSGFTVAISAYPEFIFRNGLDHLIAKLIDNLDFGNADALETGAAEIRALIIGGSMSDSITASIRSAYRALGDDVLVAVRSSGAAEDLEEASFAGQHDTYLHITGFDNLVNAVKRCWGSLWTSRATAYRQAKGFGHLDARLAVVVQTMVASDVAGVMFTANPLTAGTDEYVVNASWSPGESSVSGIVTPDEFVLDAETLRVKRKALGSKRVYTLTDEQASDLADLGQRVASYYGHHPQDIEWAMTAGQFYLLQARPVPGIAFSWDCDRENWETAPITDDDLRTRTHADEF